jgi:phospholipid/cholesterol/gamma-HCH transport system ATP-binding protein
MADAISKALGGRAEGDWRAEQAVVFSNVSISFDGRSVLEDVSFHVERGKTLCILGRSGVGKSVSLRMLMGFLKPDSGSILVEGREITTLSDVEMQEIRKRVTMVFQNGALFDSLKVRENVAFPLRERGSLEEDQIQQVVNRLLDLVGAEDVGDALPASLSTGRRRAVAIARALAAQPEVVLYDEPTTMVDPLIAHCGDARYAVCRAAGGFGAVSRPGTGAILWATEGVCCVEGG